MRSSEQLEALFTALSNAQAELEPAPKDKVNPFFKSTYADFATCIESAKPTLAKFGLCVAQTIHANVSDKSVGVTTRLAHKSGQWLEGDSWCIPKDLTPQSVGSAATYLKRYGFCGIIGLATEEDNDGNEHARDPRSKSPPPKSKTIGSTPRPAPCFTGDEDQKEVITEMLVRNGVPPEDFESIYKKMMGKPKAHLSTIIKSYAQ